jgi:hypothetical protein
VAGLGFGDQPLEREQMGGGKVGDVDIVANAGAVGRVIVGAVDFDMAALAGRRLDRDLDQMGGAGGRLAGPPVRIGAGDVEVAQRAEIDRMGGGDVPEHPLGSSAWTAIGIDRLGPHRSRATGTSSGMPVGRLRSTRR